MDELTQSQIELLETLQSLIFDDDKIDFDDFLQLAKAGKINYGHDTSAMNRMRVLGMIDTLYVLSKLFNDPWVNVIDIRMILSQMNEATNFDKITIKE